MKVKSNKHVAVGLLITSVILLPGCGFLDWIKEKFGGETPPIPTEVSEKGFDVVKDGSETIVMMEGDPIVSKASLEKEYQQLIQDNPQIAQMLPLMGGKDQLMQRLVNALTERQIVKRYITQNKIDQSRAYKDEFNRMIKSVKDMLNVKYFNQQHPVTVAEKDVREFYDKNKETMPDLLVSRGGVRAMGVKFGTEAAAQEFLDKVNAQKGDIEKAAKEGKLNVEDFKLVNAQSVGLSPELRDKISAIKSLPTTTKFKLDDTTFWVIKASKKEDPVYHDYAKIKSHLKKYLEDQEREKKLRTVMEDLKKQYKITIKEKVMPTPAPPKTKKVSHNKSAGKKESAQVAQTRKPEPAVQATQTV